MNYFTKEELLNILRLVGSYEMVLKHNDMVFSQDEIAIQNKIQSMIDNYCDHEWENICCQCSLDKIYCHKCEKDMGDLKQRYEE